MNHGFAKGRSRRANLAAEDRFSECRKRAELLVRVRLLRWERGDEEELVGREQLRGGAGWGFGTCWWGFMGMSHVCAGGEGRHPLRTQVAVVGSARVEAEGQEERFAIRMLKAHSVVLGCPGTHQDGSVRSPVSWEDEH